MSDPTLIDRLVDDLLGCPPDCGHTSAEHAAFDRGVTDGEARKSDDAVPEHYGTDQREAWLAGHSVGALLATLPAVTS